MENRNYNTPGLAGNSENFTYRRRLSWGAIFAGTVTALSVQLLLTLLGISVGLWTMPAAGSEFMQELGIGAAIWAILSFIIALYCGGWIAGRMSDLRNRLDGMLEGFMVWGVVTVITFMLLTTAIGGIIGGAAGLAGEALALGAEQVDDPEEVIDEYGAPTRQALDEALEDVDVREEVEQVAMAGGTAVFGAFLSLLLGAVAASFAGRQGSLSGLRETTSGSASPKAEVRE